MIVAFGGRTGCAVLLKLRGLREVAAAVRTDVERRLTISRNLYKLLLMDSAANLNAVFSALADPTRRAILARLATGEATVSELAGPFEMTQPAISQHLKVLEGAGMISWRVEGTRRPRRLEAAGMEAMDEWLAMLRKGLETSYARLDGVLAAMESGGKKGGGTRNPGRKNPGKKNPGRKIQKREKG
jgi:DNA-binding transcriptional ArsR family regulator